MEPFNDYNPPAAPKAGKILVPRDIWATVVDTCKAFRSLRVNGGRFQIAGKTAVIDISDPLDPSQGDAQKHQPSHALETDPSMTGITGTGAAGQFTIAGMIEAPTAKTYNLDVNVARITSLISFSAKTSSGTCSITVGGQTLPVTTTLATYSFTAPAVFAVGSALTLAVSAISSATDLSFTVEAVEVV